MTERPSWRCSARRPRFAVFVGAAALAALLPVPSAGADPRTTGSVVSVTARRAYLDRGARDGLSLGAELSLERRGRAAGRCRVESLSEGHAACVGDGVLPGDRFRIAMAEVRGAEPNEAKATPLPVAPDRVEYGRRRSALLAASFAPVAFSGASASRSPALRLKAEVTVSNVVWSAFGGSSSAYDGARVDLYVRGAELGNGVRLFVDATAVQWLSKPGGALYRPGTKSMLFVRESAISSREVGLPYSFSAGRIRPWGLPGFFAIDGAQAAWRSATGGLEAGVFGGTIPDVMTLSPARAYAAGGYYALETAASGAQRWLHHEARLSVLGAPNLQQTLEAQALAQGVLGPLDGGADLQLSLTGPRGASLQGARLDFGAHPLERLRLNAGYRYAGSLDPALALLHGLSWSGRGHHADLTARYDVSSGFGLGLVGGVAQDVDAGLRRSDAGPELYFPRLFGDRVGLALGYLEEFGWTAGRSAYLQAVAMPFGVRLLARVSYFDDALVGASGSNQDLGLFLNAQAPILKWLSLRGSVLTRVGLSSAIDGDAAAGLQLDLGLRGEI